MSGRLPDRADVVVVGSGPCGAAYVRVLTERVPGISIAVLEVGPRIGRPDGVHVKNLSDPAERERAQRLSEGPGAGTEVAARRVDSPARAAGATRMVRPGTWVLPEGYQVEGEDGLPALAMSSNVGGMGAHWTCATPFPGESERIAEVQDLDGLLAEAERLLGVSRDPFADAPFADVVRERLARTLDAGRAPDRRVQPMPLAVQRHPDGTLTWSGANVVFGSSLDAGSGASLHPEVLVRRVLVEDGRAVGVLARDLTDGSEHEVRARHVVVAADALRTPQLLWASGIRPDALGRWLNDQTQVVHAVRLRDVDATRDERDPDDPRVISRHSGVSWVPYTDAEPFHGQVMQLDASPVPLAPDDVPAPGTVVGLGWFCAKDLSPEDRVTFSEDRTDGYGMPAPVVHYRLSEKDRAVVARARETVQRVGDLLGDALGDEPILLPLGASLHYQGSVRLGTDPATSVCDPTSRVHGVEGLYVAGNGVIPTATACNPTLTSVALAVAGARQIAAAAVGSLEGTVS